MGRRAGNFVVHGPRAGDVSSAVRPALLLPAFLVACSAAPTAPASPSPRGAAPTREVVFAPASSGSARAPVAATPSPHEDPRPASSDPPDAEPAHVASSSTGAPRVEGELAAYERARPVFERECKRCHASGTRLTSTAAMGGVDMSRYPFGGGTPTEVARRIGVSIGLFGRGATMPPTRLPGLRGEDAALVAAWIAAVE